MVHTLQGLLLLHWYLAASVVPPLLREAVVMASLALAIGSSPLHAFCF